VKEPSWTLLSNHGHVLVYLALDPEARMRDIATRVGITERAVQLIIGDLIDAGFVVVTRVGRRNSYTLSSEHRFRHPLEAHVRVGDFLDLFRTGQSSERPGLT
jgi:DNA-binding MarR family transcriptional regulator